ncbi:MAG: hypothetical protein O7E54_08625 [Planctomycetota bacterium]|nr:hypothetical protein [Planctomycetota bacterium]
MRALFALALLVLPLSADEVVLSNGRRISCEVLSVSDTEVEIRLPHGRMVLSRKSVEEIVREKGGAYLRREGQSSLRRGTTRTAVELYSKALEADPTDGEARAGLILALYRHADRLRREHRLEDATAALKRLVGLDPVHADARRLAERIKKDGDGRRTLISSALAALETEDLERGLDLLDKWRLRMPVDDADARKLTGSANVHAADVALRRGNLRAALDYCRVADAYGEGARVEETFHLLQPVAALEALGEGDVRAARRAIDRINTTYPDRAVPLFLRAVVHHVKGEVRDAVRQYAAAARLAERRTPSDKGLSYETVRALAADSLRATIAHPPQVGVLKWRELFLEPLFRYESSPNFVVYAPTQKTAKEIAEVAEEVYRRASRHLLGGLAARPRAELVVHADRQAYLSADLTPEGSPLSAMKLSREQTAGICYDTRDEQDQPLIRVEAYAGRPGLLVDTIPHEVAHVVQRQGFVGFRSGHWLDEGIATHYESATALARHRRSLRESPTIFGLRAFLALRSTPPDRGPLFYSQAHSLSEYLKGLRGDAEWRTFLREYATRSFEEALRTAYRIESIEALERDWLRHARP